MVGGITQFAHLSSSTRLTRPFLSSGALAPRAVVAAHCRRPFSKGGARRLKPL
ncbi:hypothetical protein ppKF707_2861 [Metapseudomonas furukawaii]|uniref:Uncharacterized protein n=1 Tax=Metapseudomonas furukawaii TaxID=1149133 RepID=A0AAD1C2V3_METFU|nr:hypothetical protein ppKF707_2861 [Pseudomonas furukawaii]BAU74589.1 hypothetical protein KF707C_29010 [Pseudomonas furukawaii]